MARASSYPPFEGLQGRVLRRFAVPLCEPRVTHEHDSCFAPRAFLLRVAGFLLVWKVVFAASMGRLVHSHVGSCSNVHNSQLLVITTDRCTNTNTAKAHTMRAVRTSPRHLPVVARAASAVCPSPRPSFRDWRPKHPRQCDELVVILMCKRARRQRSGRGRAWPGSETGIDDCNDTAQRPEDADIDGGQDLRSHDRMLCRRH
jgi:hypothetical protein